MFGKHYYLISLVLAACLVQNASAMGWDMIWTGDGHDTMWDNPANWDLVPDPAGSGVVEVVLAPTTNGSVVTIAATDVININGTIFSPDWGMTLNICGTLNFGWCFAPLGTNSANPSIINMNCNSQLNGVNLCLGDNWWWQGGPWVTLNMYDNAQVNCTNFWWGGKVNLYDNSIFTVTTNFIERTIGAITDSTKRMNIAGGTLVINGTTIATPAAYAADITNYISRGILLVYGKQYDTNEVIITIVPTTNWLANTYVCITETTQSPPI